MSITLNNSDFQCLQDQLVDLKTKNYELTEKSRRSQADFEAAKAKICSLQLKLEEQERDFQTVSSTLRKEIETVTSSNSAEADKENKLNETYKLKYKKLVQKARELQQAYEKTVAMVQQMNGRNEELAERLAKLEEENISLKDELETERRINKAPVDPAADNEPSSTGEPAEQVQSSERVAEEMQAEMERLSNLLAQSNSLNESQAQELKIMERKGAQTVRELKRQLALEKNRTEVLQGRLENLLKEPQAAATPTNLDFDIHSKLSTSSSTNDGNASLDNGSRGNNQDSNSVGSWSFVPVAKDETSLASAEPQKVQIDSISGCSTEPSVNKTNTENVPNQLACDNKSEESSEPQSPTSLKDSPQQQQFNQRKQNPTSPFSTNTTSSPYSQDTPSLSLPNGGSNLSSPSNHFKSTYSPGNPEGMLIEEQAALVDRLTKMQHDKWMLEEKLSYLEQANCSLSEDLANKSDIIKHYFIDQALKVGSYNSTESKPGSIAYSNSSSRRTSWTPSLNAVNSDKSSLKKVVDFLKERSQISLSESENISKEATKKMQLMLEETLTKCLKLQENLDHVTFELNKLKS